MPRIAPVEPPFETAVAAELSRWMPPNAPMEPLALFRTLVRHPPLAEAMLPFGRYLLSRHLSVGKREREIVIQRVCARAGCAYEWGVHAVAFAAVAGLDDATMHATAVADADDPSFTPDDKLLIRLADELHDTARVSDALWTALAARWSPEQLLDLLALAGWYRVIAYLANGAEVAVEPWGAVPPG